MHVPCNNPALKLSNVRDKIYYIHETKLKIKKIANVYTDKSSELIKTVPTPNPLIGFIVIELIRNLDFIIIALNLVIYSS